SPLALMAMPVHCADNVASTRSRIDTPLISIFALSPPPIRRARPPARTSPKVGGELVVMHGGLAPVFRALFLDIGEVLIEYDPALAGERNKALPSRASDQSEVGLARQLHAPCGEART